MLEAAKKLLIPAGRSDVPPFIVMDVMAAAAQLEAQGARVIHMEVGQPAAAAPAAARAAAAAAAAAPAGGAATREPAAARVAGAAPAAQPPAPTIKPCSATVR